MRRRDFMGWLGAGAAGLLGASGRAAVQETKAGRPNILWITCEDISPNLGCYGDAYAFTPHLDALASQGVRYTHAFSHAPVCAPARSGLITGMYPSSLGSHHMRSNATLPKEVRCYSEYLREAGYFCTNCSKTDYNFTHPDSAWDECSQRAHWRRRAPGQPFFSIFNLTITHESQIRLPDQKFESRVAAVEARHRHEPKQAPIPPYHPDTPEVRKDWAHYHDLITALDIEVQKHLDELEEAGLTEDTIVFFYSDHGAGMPRSKRWPYDSGLHVPLILRFPEKYQHLAPAPPGSTVDRLVTFVDFGPTALSLAGIEVPGVMQGKPFLGTQAAAPRDYVYAARDRMDERYDFLRAVRDHRYKYIRNYMPQLPYNQFLEYMYEMPTMRVWNALAQEGKLEGPPTLFMRPEKPFEELYDTESDPHEVRNLAGSPEYRDLLERMRGVLRAWMLEARDLGFLPEAEMHRRSAGGPQRTMALNDARYPLPRILETADMPLAGRDAVPELVKRLADDDNAVRYWAVIGLTALKAREEATIAALNTLLKDPCPSVRLAAADALYRAGQRDAALPVLAEGLESEDEWTCLRAANILDGHREAPYPNRALWEKLEQHDSNYIARVARHALTASPKSE